MSGGSGGPIILKIVRDALRVSCNRSGSVKLWMVVLAFGAVCWLAGKFF